MLAKPLHVKQELEAYCTVCGDTLRDKSLEKYQIRWENKNSGVCQKCIVRLRKNFRTQRNKTPIKFRNEEFYALVEFDEECVAMAESENGSILGEIRDTEHNSSLGVLIQNTQKDPNEDDAIEDFGDFDDFEDIDTFDDIDENEDLEDFEDVEDSIDCSSSEDSE